MGAVLIALGFAVMLFTKDMWLAWLLLIAAGAIMILLGMDGSKNISHDTSKQDDSNYP